MTKMIRFLQMINKLFTNIWLFVSYVALIVLLVALPLNSTGSLNNITIITFRGDYFFHALAFLPWVFFKPSFNQTIALWLFLGLLFAAGTEGMQYILPYRAFNVNDLVANIFGVFIGFGIVSLIKSLKVPD